MPVCNCFEKSASAASSSFAGESGGLPGPEADGTEVVAGLDSVGSSGFESNSSRTSGLSVSDIEAVYGLY